MLIIVVLKVITKFLTPCRQATQKCVIAIPRVVDGSRISTFSYTSCTCICQLVWLTFRFKVIDSLIFYGIVKLQHN